MKVNIHSLVHVGKNEFKYQSDGSECTWDSLIEQDKSCYNRYGIVRLTVSGIVGGWSNIEKTCISRS